VIDKLAAAGIPYKDPSRLVLIWLRSVHETGPSKMFDSFRDYRAFARAEQQLQPGVLEVACCADMAPRRGAWQCR
jgi:hypothetical protein